MAFHAEAKGVDLHEPSRARVLNSSGAEILAGTFVFIGVAQNSDGFIPISRVATTADSEVGLVQVNLAENATSTVLTFGRVENIDTSTFNVGQLVKLGSSTTFSALSANDIPIGRVIVVSATAGIITLDTTSSSGGIIGEYTQEFTNSDWVDQGGGNFMLDIVHSLNNDKAAYDIYDSNNMVTFLETVTQTSTRIELNALSTEIFAGRITVFA